MGCSPWLNRVEAELRRQRFRREFLVEARDKIQRLRKLSRVVPEQRQKICMLTTELTRLTNEVLDMTKKEAQK